MERRLGRPPGRPRGGDLLRRWRPSPASSRSASSWSAAGAAPTIRDDDDPPEPRPPELRRAAASAAASPRWFPDRAGNVLGLTLALRLGRLSVHRLRHAEQLQRRADQRAPRLEPRRLRQPARPRRRCSRSRRWRSSLTLPLVPLYAAGERGLRLRTRGGRRLALLRPLGALRARLRVRRRRCCSPTRPSTRASRSSASRTVKSQIDRVSPFSIWGQIDLGLAEGAGQARRRRARAAARVPAAARTLTQIAALAARGDHRHRADARALVLPLHPLVRRGAARGDGRRPAGAASAQRFTRLTTFRTFRVR